jgi:hypothetical protein
LLLFGDRDSDYRFFHMHKTDAQKATHPASCS